VTLDEANEIIKGCSFFDYSMRVHDSAHNGMYLQAVYKEADIVTGIEDFQYTRKWIVSPHMTKSELVQTAFKMCLTSMEHRAREHFRYKGKAIFGPHFDVDALHEICTDKRYDYRKDVRKETQ
jgi:hypothetical protein